MHCNPIKYRIIGIAALLLIGCSLPLCAEGTPFAKGLFRYSPYGRALLSDVHPDYVRLDINYMTNRSEWDWGQTGKGMRIATATNLGVTIPLWRGNIVDERYGLSLGEPVIFNIWLDLTEPVTAPVVDTDYRIALPECTFIHRLNKGFATNYSIRFAPFKHESTHIGDELALQHADHGLPLRRVNASYNYSETVFTLNDPEDSRREYHTLRLGLMLLWDWKEGWYSVKPGDGDESLLQTRNSPWELYLQYQYQSPVSKHGFQAVASAEIRNRALYGYPQQDWDATNGVSYTPQAQSRIFTYNIFVGARYVNPWYDGLMGRLAVGLRAYHGNNYFGQFRNYDNVSHIGLCFIYQ
ncbi:MAG: hypothetical protein IJ581_04460 [Paludibacteraceae bacterium]|nr:hypothetical protein [Paludibacteraceae bacterium]